MFIVGNDEVIEDKTEGFGFPNVSHSGKLLYNNTSFKKRSEAVKCANKNLKAEITLLRDLLRDRKKEVTSLENKIKKLKEIKIV